MSDPAKQIFELFIQLVRLPFRHAPAAIIEECFQAYDGDFCDEINSGVKETLMLMLSDNDGKQFNIWLDNYRNRREGFRSEVHRVVQIWKDRLKSDAVSDEGAAQ